MAASPEWPSISKNGRLVFDDTMRDTDLWQMQFPDKAGAPPAITRLAVSSTRLDHSPSLSPDGQRLVFVSERSGRQEMWIAKR